LEIINIQNIEERLALFGCISESAKSTLEV